MADNITLIGKKKEVESVEIDFSLDIETLGTKPGSVVTEVGMCNSFTTDELHIYLPLNPQRQLGLMIDQETAKWHEDNNPNFNTMLEACQTEDQTQVVLIHNLQQIAKYVQAICGENNKAVFWMNSPNFDAVLLEVVFDLVGLPYPWKYYALRDLRTLRDLAGMDKDHPNLPAKPDNAHGALADAKYQLEIVELCRDHINVVPF